MRTLENFLLFSRIKCNEEQGEGGSWWQVILILTLENLKFLISTHLGTRSMICSLFVCQLPKTMIASNSLATKKFCG